MGNYRQDVFETADKAQAFEKALWQTCARTGWRLYAYALMRNHYHLAFETPRPNLVEGMHWLQTTFATRFNRFRNERGHLFQGRYQALLVEPGAPLVRLVNYIHLNPVRAGIVPIERVAHFRWSSLRRLFTAERPLSFRPEVWLEDAGFSDDAEGRQAYRDSLARQSGDQSLAITLHDEFCRGWAIGTLEWRKAVAADFARHDISPHVPFHELQQIKTLGWEACVEQLLAASGKTNLDLQREPKSASWKIAIAEAMRRETEATNPWLAARLHMGATSSVSQYLSWVRHGQLSIRRLAT